MSDELPDLFPEGILSYEPLEEGYAIMLPAPFQRTEMQQGPADQERIFRNGVTTFDVTYPMTPDEFEIFFGWLNATGGAYSWHNAPMFRGNRYETLAVRFVVPMPKPTLSNGEWMVSGQLETYDYQPLDETSTDALMITVGTDMSVADIATIMAATLHTLAEAVRDAGL